MAFVNAVTTKERFSLLLLEPGEIYFEDYSVYFYPAGLPETDAIKKRQKGRLKVCSKSILFEPTEITCPILKFLYSNIKRIEQWKTLSKLDKNNVILIECEQLIQMKEGNIIAPYVFVKKKGAYLFSLNYGSIEDCLPQISQLHRASTLPPHDQAAMIAAIVLSRQSRVSFDTSWLEDLSEKIIMKTQGDRITPLVTNPGRIMLTSSRLYFQPYNNAESFPVLKIKLSNIRRIIKRRFLLQHLAMEIFCAEDSPNCHLFLALKSQEDRNLLYDKILEQPGLLLDCVEQENMTLQWQNGNLSNFDYLMYLNSMADRSFNDLMQYPVFPWILTDYTSYQLDLKNPKIFRDLSKPIGALNSERLQRLKERYNEMPEIKFLYGSHYSTPGFVLYYLVRKAPEYMLCLQNGRFDQPDRMFYSIFETWKNCLYGAADFKELIPEFYMPPGDFLVNTQDLYFGVRQDGLKVSDVILPPWAKDALDFVTKLREALESEYVSKNLHHWIDLIFGYKQKGMDAELADNVFYYLTYEGSVNLQSIRDLNERDSITVQIMEFGQTPTQLFTKPHPQRYISSIFHLTDFSNEMSEEILNCDSITKTSSSSQVEMIPVEKKSSLWQNMDRFHPSMEYVLHRESITGVRLSSDAKSIFSVSKDELMKMYSVEEKRQLRSVHLSNMVLSSCLVMPDDKTVVIGSWDSNVYIYSIEFGKIIGTTLSHFDAVSSLCWRNNMLITGSWDSCVRIWKFNPQCPTKSRLKSASSDLLAELDHDSGVNCVDINVTATLLVSGTKDGQVYIWDIERQYNFGPYQAHSGTVNAVAFSPDSQRIISCGSDQYMRVFDVATGTEIFSKDAGEELRCICWDGSIVLAGGSFGQLVIWDLIKVILLARISGHTGIITCIDITEDGSTMVTGGSDNKIILWRKT